MHSKTRYEKNNTQKSKPYICKFNYDEQTKTLLRKADESKAIDELVQPLEFQTHKTRYRYLSSVKGATMSKREDRDLRFAD